VRKVDGLPSVREDQARTFFLVSGLAHVLSRIKALFLERSIPSENFVLGNEHVGMTIAGQINEADMRIVQADIGELPKRPEGFPVEVDRALVEPSGRACKSDDIELP